MRTTIIGLMILAASFSTDLLAQSDLSVCKPSSLEVAAKKMLSSQKPEQLLAMLADAADAIQDSIPKTALDPL